MKRFFFIVLLVFHSSILFSQGLEITLQNAIDSIYEAHASAIGIMVHVESPNKNISWTGVSGYGDKVNKTAIDPEQPALIASSIKTYVSASILRLVEEKKISLEDPISLYLSKKTTSLFTNGGYDLESIKIKHLLSHTSGIQNYATQEYIDDKDKNKMFRWTRDAQLALTIEIGDPLALPGKQFTYADSNYLLLTEIIENTTAKPFYESMRELLKYDKLGLNDTWFPTLEDKPKQTKELVHQYWGEYGWDSYNLDVSWDLYGGGGIACPPKDMALFIHNYFNGNIIENDSIQKLILSEIKTKETEEYPYYYGISPDNYHGLIGYGHGGFWGTVMMHFPEINTSIAVYILERDKRILRRDVLEKLTEILLKNQD